jgi:hypothetical protein
MIILLQIGSDKATKTLFTYKTNDRNLCCRKSKKPQVPAILFIPDYTSFYQEKSLDWPNLLP